MNKEQIQKKALDTLAEAKALEVLDQISFDVSSEFLRDIKALKKEVDETFDPIVKKAHSTWKEAIEQKKKHYEPLEKAEYVLKSKIQKYREIQNEKRRIEEARLRKEAEEKERKAREELAEKLRQEQNEEAAKEILEQPIEIPNIVVEDTTKAEGISYRKIWKYRITDIAKVPDEYKIIDDKKVSGIVRAMKNETNIPGIEAYFEEVVSARV